MHRNEARENKAKNHQSEKHGTRIRTPLNAVEPDASEANEVRGEARGEVVRSRARRVGQQWKNGNME